MPLQKTTQRRAATRTAHRAQRLGQLQHLMEPIGGGMQHLLQCSCGWHRLTKRARSSLQVLRAAPAHASRTRRAVRTPCVELLGQTDTPQNRSPRSIVVLHSQATIGFVRAPVSSRANSAHATPLW